MVESNQRVRFCFLFKQGMSGVYHRCSENDMPACGSRVDVCALEIADEKPSGCVPCKRCFREGR